MNQSETSIKSDTVFRERRQPEESAREDVQEKAAEVTGVVEDPDKIEVFSGKTDSLDDWETVNGKYGLAYFGIKEIGKTFPIKAQFGVIDKYIREEMDSKGYDKTPERWQDVLKGLEEEIGSDKLNVYDRMKKLVSLIRIIKKQNELKAKRELYANKIF